MAVVKTVVGSHSGAGAPPFFVYLSGDWDVHGGYGVLTHGQISDFGDRRAAEGAGGIRLAGQGVLCLVGLLCLLKK